MTVASAGAVRFVTFGCKANQCDTQVLREALVRRGWRECERDAELVLVTTCTVTAEDERAFEHMLDAVRALGFARVHAFPFSARPGTAAHGRADEVPVPTIRERRARLAEVAHEAGDVYRRTLAGLSDTVVLEGAAVGLSGRYQRVRVPVELATNGVVEVELAVEEAADGPRLRGLAREAQPA